MVLVLFSSIFVQKAPPLLASWSHSSGRMPPHLTALLFAPISQMINVHISGFASVSCINVQNFRDVSPHLCLSHLLHLECDVCTQIYFLHPLPNCHPGDEYGHGAQENDAVNQPPQAGILMMKMVVITF